MAKYSKLIINTDGGARGNPGPAGIGVVVKTPDGEVVKARDLSGQPGWLFRRNSVTGALEAVRRAGSWGDLNAELHAN